MTKYIPPALFLILTLASGLKNSCKADDGSHKPGKVTIVSKSKDSAGANSGEVVEGFALAIKTEARSATEEERGYFLGGESVVVVATITNTTQNQLTLIDRDPLIDLQFVVKDSEQRVVPRTRFGKRIKKRANSDHIGRVATLGIPAGKSEEFKFYLNRQFDLSLSEAYSVQVTRTISKWDGSDLGNLKSNILMFEIR